MFYIHAFQISKSKFYINIFFDRDISTPVIFIYS